MASAGAEILIRFDDYDRRLLERLSESMDRAFASETPAHKPLAIFDVKPAEQLINLDEAQLCHN